MLVTVALVAASSAAGIRVAAAQDRASAEVLFEEGRRLAAQGDYDGARKKFEESERLDPAAGTLLNLADCEERLGRTASAWAALREAAARAELAGETARANAAREKAAALEPSLPSMKIVMTARDPAKPLEIRRDGTAIGSTLWGTAVPVDPGHHVLEEVSGGAVAWSQTIDVPRSPVQMIVFVPEVPPSRAVREATEPRPPRGVTVQQDAAKAGVVDSRRTIAFVLLAAGAGGIASAAIAGAGALIAKSRGRPDEAYGWAMAFDWTIVPSGLAFLSGAALLAVTSSRRDPKPPRVVMLPQADPHGVGLVAIGTY
jgi:tetratricopeptide (TPR) repeat protein